MDNQLHRLKESMDDTVLKDIGMNKKLKGRILKDIYNENEKKYVHIPSKKWNLKAMVASCVALFLLFVIGASILDTSSNGHQEQQQRVDMLKLHMEIIATLKTQVRIENEIFKKLNTRDYSITELQDLKEEAANNSLNVSKKIGEIYIPDSLFKYDPKINESMDHLQRSYLSRSSEIMEFEKWIKMQQEEKKSYPLNDVNSELYFFQFMVNIQHVYEALGLNKPSYIMELNTTTQIDESDYVWFKIQNNGLE